MKQWEGKEIANIMNNAIEGWKPHGTHRFGKEYGIQRSWKRMEDSVKKDKDGFIEVPEQKMMKQGRLGYNSSNGRYGLLSSDLWIDTGFHCGEGLEVLVDDEWVQTRMEMNLAREWYLVGTPYCGDLEYVQARIPE